MEVRSSRPVGAGSLGRARNAWRDGRADEAFVFLWNALATAGERELLEIDALARQMLAEGDGAIQSEAQRVVAAVKAALESRRDTVVVGSRVPERVGKDEATDATEAVSEADAGTGTARTRRFRLSRPAAAIVLIRLGLAVALAVAGTTAFRATPSRAPTVPAADRTQVVVMDANGEFERVVAGDVRVWALPSDWWPHGHRLLFTQADAYGVLRLDLDTGTLDWGRKDWFAHISDATVSPDGETLAFVFGGDITLASIDRIDVIRRVTTDGLSHSPQWSPDGSRIAFESTRSGKSQIYVMNADGTAVVQVTTRRNSNSFSPTWSPDGRRLAFAAAYTANWEIYVADLHRMTIRRVTHTSAQESDPAWSPDGRRFAYAADVDGQWNIYVANTDGNAVRQLTVSPSNERGPLWSPDGRFIAFWRAIGSSPPRVA